MAPAKHGAQAHRGKAGGFMFQGKPGLHRCSEAAVREGWEAQRLTSWGDGSACSCAPHTGKRGKRGLRVQPARAVRGITFRRCSPSVSRKSSDSSWGGSMKWRERGPASHGIGAAEGSHAG
jgi:hypothetical protein